MNNPNSSGLENFQATMGFLRQQELAERWKLSPRTLERWRWLGTGPLYHKIGAAWSIGSRTSWRGKTAAPLHAPLSRDFNNDGRS